jgi:predicted nucleic acid-binding protein
MPKTVISDASCFIIFEKIGRLDVLNKTYDTVYTTPIIASEFGLPLPEWVTVRSPSDRKRQSELSSRVDKGEASAIVLALELKDVTLILDDQKARKIAEALGIEVTGTLGVLVRAKLSGIIPSIKPLIADIRSTNFRLSPEIELEALRLAGEDS